MNKAMIVYDGLNIPHWSRRGPYEVAAFNTDWGRVVYAEGIVDGLLHRFFDITLPGAATPTVCTYAIEDPAERAAEFPTGFMLNGRWIVFSPKEGKAYMLPKHHEYADYKHLSERRVPRIVLSAQPSA